MSWGIVLDTFAVCYPMWERGPKPSMLQLTYFQAEG